MPSRDWFAVHVFLVVALIAKCGAFITERSWVQQFTLRSQLKVIEYDDFLPSPNPNLDAQEVVHVCMESLMQKSNSEGLEVCFKFSSDFLQAPFGGQLEKFIAHANNPVFASLVKCTKYEIISIGSVIEGNQNRGAMQTFLMKVQSTDSGERSFLWTMQKERRPPRQDCWLVREVLFTDNAMQLTT